MINSVLLLPPLETCSLPFSRDSEFIHGNSNFLYICHSLSDVLGQNVWACDEKFHTPRRLQLWHSCVMACSIVIYRMAGNFRGVLIFVIFVVDVAVTKISTHEN